MSAEETIVLQDSELRDPPLVLRDQPLIAELRIGAPGGGEQVVVMRAVAHSLEVVTRVELRVHGFQRSRGGQFGLGDGRSEMRVTGIPWQTVEEIARYIEGDGTDAQRIALADGIRTSRFVSDTRSRLESPVPTS